jgi:hypothetical protein
VPAGQAAGEDGAEQRGTEGTADGLEEVQRAGGGAQVAMVDRVLAGEQSYLDEEADPGAAKTSGTMTAKAPLLARISSTRTSRAVRYTETDRFWAVRPCP